MVAPAVGCRNETSSGSAHLLACSLAGHCRVLRVMHPSPVKRAPGGSLVTRSEARRQPTAARACNRQPMEPDGTSACPGAAEAAAAANRARPYCACVSQATHHEYFIRSRRLSKEKRQSRAGPSHTHICLNKTVEATREPRALCDEGREQSPKRRGALHAGSPSAWRNRRANPRTEAAARIAPSLCR